MSHENSSYATKLLKEQGKSVFANRLTTDAEPNIFTDERKKQCAERRGFGKPKNRKKKDK